MMIKARTPPLMYIREPPLVVVRGYPLKLESEHPLWPDIPGSRWAVEGLFRRSEGIHRLARFPQREEEGSN